MNMRMPRGQGFTLIELVVGMMLVGVALSVLSMLLLPLAGRTADTQSRVTAIEIANSLMEQIWVKPFDSMTLDGACIQSSSNCTLSNRFGSENNNNQLSDVDDYHGFNQGSMMSDTKTYAQMYPNFKIKVDVAYAMESGEKKPNEITNYKLITITVTTPIGEAIYLEAIRGNY